MDIILQAMAKIREAENLMDEAQTALESAGAKLCRPRRFAETKNACLVLYEDGIKKMAEAAGEKLVHPHWDVNNEECESNIGFLHDGVFYFTLVHERIEDDDISD